MATKKEMDIKRAQRLEEMYEMLKELIKRVKALESKPKKGGKA